MAGSSHVFYETEIEGTQFKAFIISEGPYLNVKYRNGRESGTALGVSTIDHFTPRAHVDLGNGNCLMGETKSGWWIAKYGNQPTVDINSLSEAGRHMLMQRFGILLDHSRRDANEAFSNSDAFQGLCQWVKKHPRIAKRYVDAQTYLLWVSMVEEALSPK